ncbi:MAG: biotin--[acetyl-CoA-carboxylase] ligase [Bacteroidota bacterium]
MNTIGNTLFVGKVLLHFPQLSSTNQYALELLSNSRPSEGTVISTYNQVHGRGQIGSTWESEAFKNISLSAIFYPHFLLARQQFDLNQAISLAVFDFLLPYVGPGLKVKWPNDIYVEDDKITGILIQNTIIGQHLQASVVGLGININQVHFSQEIPNPTSLKILRQKDYDLDTLVGELCQCLERRYLQLRNGHWETIRADYLKHLYRYMEDHLFQDQDGKVFSGRITGVKSSGYLQVSHNQGESSFDLKQIRFI